MSRVIVVNKYTMPAVPVHDTVRVYIGRPSILGNPYAVSRDVDNRDEVNAFSDY